MGPNNRERAETATALSEGVCAALNVDKLEDMLDKLKLTAENEEIEFFQRMPYFQGWSKRAI